MAASKKASGKPDFATIGGILLAFGGIVGGLLLEGGKIQDIIQITAAIIVLGGTFGAVMGLIQVMKNLANIEEVGHGIAVAFVATVYGVGISNIVLIPAGNKIKARIEQQVELQQLVLEGVIGIIEGLNPKLIRSKLEAFQVGGKASAKSEAASKATAGAGRPVAVEN